MFDRFRDLFPRKRPTPALTLRALRGGVEDQTLRMCGLSRQKRAYMLDLAQRIEDGRLPLRRLRSMEDEQVTQALVQVHGIGRWTAEMFLIFTLCRRDVLPVDDLGLREACRRAWGLRERPGARVISERAEAWRPWRTVATWYLWRWLEG